MHVSQHVTVSNLRHLRYEGYTSCETDVQAV